jgi:hypothetical protein
MSEKDFSINTLTDSQASAIIEAYKFTFPDLIDGKDEPFIQRKDFRDDQGAIHKALFIFGNLIFFDESRKCYVIRRLADKFNELGELYWEEDSTHKDIESIIKRILQRQLECRLRIFFSNEIDENDKEIPFSSRYECACHGKKHKEYEYE